MYSVHVDVLAADLSAEQGVDQVIEWVATEKFVVETLINNAGFGDLGELIQADWSKLNDMISLNISCLTRLSQIFAGEMKKRGRGEILNLGSMAGFLPGPYMAVYFATKAYVASFSVALAEELRPFGVHVGVLCPSSTKTEFASRADAQNSPLFAQEKLASADQVAQAAYQGMKQRRVVIFPSLRLQTLAWFARTLPLPVAARITKRSQET